MKIYNSKIHNRQSIRLKGYDYSSEGLYFITLCVEGGILLFVDIIENNLKLNEFGDIAKEEWEKTEQIRDNIHLHEYIIMPNHFHAIIEIIFSKNRKPETELNIFKSPSQTIGAIIRGYKGATTKRIKELIYLNGEGKERGGEEKEKKYRWGELQFAPTIAPTNLPQIIRQIDLDKSIWQRNYYDRIIRNQPAYQAISKYIINNPKKWNNDNFYK